MPSLSGDKNRNVVFAARLLSQDQILLFLKSKQYLCKSSSPFEEDANPWLEGGEEEKKEEEAVKDYFLNITSHHTKVMEMLVVTKILQ